VAEKPAASKLLSFGQQPVIYRILAQLMKAWPLKYIQYLSMAWQYVKRVEILYYSSKWRQSSNEMKLAIYLESVSQSIILEISMAAKVIISMIFECNQLCHSKLAKCQ